MQLWFLRPDTSVTVSQLWSANRSPAAPRCRPTRGCRKSCGIHWRGVTASNGLLLVRPPVRTPLPGLMRSEEKFTLVVNDSRRGDDRTTKLAFRACGTGFVAPTSWIGSDHGHSAGTERDHRSVAATISAGPPRSRGCRQASGGTVDVVRAGQRPHQSARDTEEAAAGPDEKFLASDPCGSSVAPVVTIRRRGRNG